MLLKFVGVDVAIEDDSRVDVSCGCISEIRSSISDCPIFIVRLTDLQWIYDIQ